MKSRKSSKIKQLAVKGLVSRKIKLGKIKPMRIFWHIGAHIYGPHRHIVMSELELKLAYNKDGFVELPATWGGDNISIKPPFIDYDVLSDVYANITIDPIPHTEEQLQQYGDMCKDSFNVEDFRQAWKTHVDNTFLLRTNATYPIYLREGYILIDNRKYRFELDTKGLGLDIDGDGIQTSIADHTMVCRSGCRIDLNYKKIKILGEL